uniref:Uncharacterized protein n=1 Tax=Parascaris univalens TaxID=6257 RepID=A0A914ZKA3_PARUN
MARWSPTIAKKSSDSAVTLAELTKQRYCDTVFEVSDTILAAETLQQVVIVVHRQDTYRLYEYMISITASCETETSRNKNTMTAMTGNPKPLVIDARRYHG